MSPPVACAGILVSEGGLGGISLGLCLGIPNAFLAPPGARRRLLRQLERGCFSPEERRLNISAEQGLKRFGAIQTLPRGFLWSKCCSDTCSSAPVVTARGGSWVGIVMLRVQGLCLKHKRRKTRALLYLRDLDWGETPYPQLDTFHCFMSFSILGLVYQVLASIHPLALAAP